jgi:hypothetical protein
LDKAQLSKKSKPVTPSRKEKEMAGSLKGGEAKKKPKKKAAKKAAKKKAAKKK